MEWSTLPTRLNALLSMTFTSVIGGSSSTNVTGSNAFSLVGNVGQSIFIVIKMFFIKTSVKANILGVSTGAY